MAKQLRLAVAGLTDVGRRRERNQDNVTHYVPTDERLLEEKGALFVVCDGMGGHAAGEVASELGVNTLRDAYYASPEKDIIRSFADAVKRANQTIFGYAREHPEMTGMGTTCVALVVHSGRGYFVNIGDSRAYLIRDDAMRQVTFDHSWVAEQVRVGLLTEEQARTHAHRNVITRSLGTQPTVNADLFVETLRDGDRVLLCSDGLHGYVDEQAIEREMVKHHHPESGAQNLVDMANANGGPDNITALVVHMLEVPEVAGDVFLPVPEEGEEQTITQPLPAMRRSPATKKSQEARERVNAEETARPEGERHGAAVATVTAKRSRSGAGRVALAAVRLLALAALITVAVGVWYFGFGPYAQAQAATQRVDADVASAHTTVQQAQSQDPAQALTSLAKAQQKLQADTNDEKASEASRTHAQQILDVELATAVQDAVQRYNTSAQITPLPSGGMLTHEVSCVGPDGAASTSLTGPSQLISVAMPVTKGAAPTAGNQTLYALNAGTIYRLDLPIDASGAASVGPATCAALPLTSNGVTTTVAIASDGGSLFALVQTSAAAYVVLSLPIDSVNPNGTFHVKPQQRVAVATPHGETPKLLAVQGNATYIAFTSTAGSPGIWTFTDNGDKGPQQTTPLTQEAVSLAAANNTLYALLNDGSIGQLDPKAAYLPLPVTANAPVTVDMPSTYTSATPIPTPATTGATGGSLFKGNAVLAADPGLHSHIFIGDGVNHRAIRFTGNAQAPGLTLATQYVYGSYYPEPKLLALSANEAKLNSYVWTGGRLLTFTVDEPAS